MTQLPVKFRVFQIIAQNKGISNEAIYHILKAEYPHDRHVTPQGVDNYLMSLKAVGLIRRTHALLTDKGELLQEYQLTDDGVNKLKYVNGGYDF